MTTFYFDASALVKRYSPEIGTDWMQSLMGPIPGHSVLTAEFTLAEVAAAISAKQRASPGITLEERDHILADFGFHCQREYRLLVVDRLIVDLAVELTKYYRLRGYDAIHLATALTVNSRLRAWGLQPLTLVAADNDLLKAARAEGLVTENPNDHP